MEFYVADTYKNYEYDVEKRFVYNDKLYVNARCRCGRCQNGVYVIPPYFSGTCFTCHGTGYIDKTIRLYTEKEHLANERAKQRAEEKRIAKINARIAQDEADSDKNKAIYMERNGFNADGVTYCIGGDTYAIKDKLKELGCKFNPVLKWHSPTPIDLDVPIAAIHFEDIYTWNCHSKEAISVEDAENKIYAALAKASPAPEKTYMGEVGDKFEVSATFINVHTFGGYYGATFVYTFDCGDHTLVWKTTKALGLTENDTVTLKGTIKSHEEYRGSRNTIVTRCKIV